MKVIWEGSLDGTVKSSIYRVLLEVIPATNSTRIPSYVVEKRGYDSLGGIKWDLEHLENAGYKSALSRALESLAKVDAEVEKTGFRKCDYCNGSGWDTFTSGLEEGAA